MLRPHGPRPGCPRSVITHAELPLPLHQYFLVIACDDWRSTLESALTVMVVNAHRDGVIRALLQDPRGHLEPLLALVCRLELRREGTTRSDELAVHIQFVRVGYVLQRDRDRLDEQISIGGRPPVWYLHVAPIPGEAVVVAQRLNLLLPGARHLDQLPVGLFRYDRRTR